MSGAGADHDVPASAGVPEERRSASRSLVAVSEAKEIWRVVAKKFVAVRAEPRHDSLCLGARKPGARVLVACRDEGWVRLHRDEGYGDQPAWMLIDGEEIGMGVLIARDTSMPLQMAMEAGPQAKLSHSEVVVAVRKLGQGNCVEVRVPKECKICELRTAFAEYVGRPELMSVKLLRKNSEPTKFRPYRTDDPGYTSLKDGDDLGPTRTVFVIKGNIDPAPGSPADTALRALLPAHVYLLAIEDDRLGHPKGRFDPERRRIGPSLPPRLGAPFSPFANRFAVAAGDAAAADRPGGFDGARAAAGARAGPSEPAPARADEGWGGFDDGGSFANRLPSGHTAVETHAGSGGLDVGRPSANRLPSGRAAVAAEPGAGQQASSSASAPFAAHAAPCAGQQVNFAARGIDID